MKLTKTLGYLGLIASVLVGLGGYFPHYSTNILEHSKDYKFFKFVALDNLTTGHFLAIIGLSFYFVGYIYIYRMLKFGNGTLTRQVLTIGFIALAIGSQIPIGNSVHLKDTMETSTYQNLLIHYTNHMEVLVQALPVIIAILSVVFTIAILKRGTYYKKWMAILNPIVILIISTKLTKNQL